MIILDFGGQHTQLIARQAKNNHVYAEAVPWNTPAREIAAMADEARHTLMILIHSAQMNSLT